MSNKFVSKKIKIDNNFLILGSVIVLVFVLGYIFGSNKQYIERKISRQNVSSDNNSLPNELDYSGVNELYGELKSRFDGQLDQTKLEEGLKKGLVEAAGDPYTEFFTAEEAKDFQQGLSGSFEGIGAELGKEKDSIVIISPISGFPAEKAGLKSKDIIIKIDDESAYDLTVSEAVKKIRGPKGTSVKLTIIRDGEQKEISIVRDKITVPSVTSKIIENNIGVIEISQFGNDTVELANSAAADLKSKNVSGIILDLRGNPGGLLEAAVDISSLWLENGTTVVQEKRGDEVLGTNFAKGDPILGGIKTVVLIDGGSASASEIVAGALKDNGAATIIGEKSYGKGSVQEVKDLDFGGALKVTIAKWYTPNGRNIDQEGIKPDKIVKNADSDTKEGNDSQKKAAIKYIIGN